MWPAVADFLVSADPVTIIAATHTRVSGRSGSIRFTWILYADVSDIGATGVILIDMNPDPRMANNLRQAVESEGDQLADLHLWRLGPGHLGGIISVVTTRSRGAD